MQQCQNILVKVLLLLIRHYTKYGDHMFIQTSLNEYWKYIVLFVSLLWKKNKVLSSCFLSDVKPDLIKYL